MAKKKRKATKQPSALVPSRKMAKKASAINPVVGVVVAVTMILALVITVLPGLSSNQSASGASRPSGGQQVNSATQQRIQSLEQALQSSPNDVGTLTQLGNEYFDSGQYGKAIENYTQVLDQTPDNTNVRTDLGISYYYSGMTNNAIREYKKALEVEPNKAQTLFNLGIAYADASPPNTDDAISMWQKVVQLYPGTEDAKKAQDFINKYKK